MFVRFPFQIDASGRIASSMTYDDHIIELIEQVLFTVPGERVNRPDFGCGILLLVFQPETSQITAATAAMIHSSLSQWMGTLISVTDVTGQVIDTELIVTVSFVNLQTGAPRVAEFRRAV